MDNTSRICFALASHVTQDIVMAAAKTTQLKTLVPTFASAETWTAMTVSKHGHTEHEKLMSHLWEFLGHRCVYCGISDKRLKTLIWRRFSAGTHICPGLAGFESYQRGSVLLLKGRMESRDMVGTARGML